MIVQRQLAKMGWHCITIWECELAKERKEKTLASLAFTLNHIFLTDHKIHYPSIEEEGAQMDMAAEPTINTAK